MSFQDILKTRHLASIIILRNMLEEAHDSGSAEGQCPAAPLSPNDGPERRERDAAMKMVPTPAGECFPWKDPEFGPWFLGHEILRGVDAH